MEVIVDRIEGEYLVVEIDVGTTINMPLSLAPDAKEGDTIKISVEKGENSIKKNVDNLVNNLFED